jgi:ADP-dependent NAD(P)H-hydrate dehydratase
MTNVTNVDSLPKLPMRIADAHKGTFGTALIVAGSRGMSGAAVLCGSAALRGGAGLVRVATAADVQPIVAAGNPCYMTACLPVELKHHSLADDAAPMILELAADASVLAIGPGLGLAGSISEIIEIVLVQAQRPVVLDADGLNALAKQSTDVLSRRPAPTVMTPHPGEFARLIKVTTREVQANRRELALRFAETHNVVLLLKGHETLVTDGRRIYRNTTGNPGMATGGSGDVLTGLIAALIAQGLAPFEAAQLGAYVHGKAGDLAAEDKGQVGLIASDLLDHLPRALRAAS